MRPSCLLACLAATLLLPVRPASPQAPESASPEMERALRHQSEEWQLLEPHLPDLHTASAQQLQLEGDVLRARRFEEDALDYYRAALLRGGDESILMNRIGITELVLRRPELARACFHRAVALRPGDAQAWNNLGASEYFLGNHRAALIDYQHALKLDRTSALFHSNLGNTYFEMQDYESASRQFALAFRLDPHIFNEAAGAGIQAHMLTTERGRFCFELARIAATGHQDAAVIDWLGKALDVDYDIRAEMQKYAVFAPYLRDPRVQLLIANSRALHAGHPVTARLPALPESAPDPGYPPGF